MSLLKTCLTIVRRIVSFSRERGALSVASSCGRWGVQWALGRAALSNATSGTFEWDGRPVQYLNHRYNHTWLNERAVEGALARDVLAEAAGSSILEVGNVMAHYGPVDHLVVDKYERAEGVLNVDVADLESDRAFDLVISISTLEHVGLDEDVVDPTKPARAIETLKGLLAPGGRLWVTIPVGYNLALDEQLRSGEIAFTRMRALRREPGRNVWRQVGLEELWDASYDRLLYTAHGLVVADYTAPTTPSR